MLSVPALHGLGGLLVAGGLGGLLVGAHVLGLAHDGAVIERAQRQVRLCRPLLEEAVRTHEVERTARELGVAVDGLKAQIAGAADFRADVRSLLSAVVQYVGHAQN